MKKGAPLIILLVEDDAAHAEIVRRSLADLRIDSRLIHLEDGQAGLDYLLEEGPRAQVVDHPRPDLILLDLRLPKVDGLELLHRIKAAKSLRRIPTVVLTTSGAESDRARAYEAGAGSFLVKPVDFGKFQKMMESFGHYWLVWNQYPA